MDKYSIVFYFLLFGFPTAPEVLAEETTRRDITEYLLNEKRYDSFKVPELDDDFRTNVTVQILLYNMHSVNEVAMEYSTDIYLRMWWRDKRLDYREITNLTNKLELDSRQIDRVWHPNIFFENEKKAFIHSVPSTNRLMHVYSNGTVVYSIRLSLTLSCTMSLQYYPFDAQNCPLIIQSCGARGRGKCFVVTSNKYIKTVCYTIDNIHLRWHGTRPVVVSKFEMPQYDLLTDEIVTSSYNSKYEETGVFSTLKVELNLSRKIGYYILQVFFPSIFLVALSWVSFWVDPEAVPARVSLGVTCVLTMTTQCAGIQQSLPPVSYVKAIDVWMFVCLSFVFAALLEFAYVNASLRKKNVKNDSEDKKKIESSPQDRRLKALLIDNVSKIMFPSTFILFAFIFFMVSGLA